MGIKGIYKEIGEGERKSLSKLAVEHLEKTGRPLRLAIDVSIWQFQVQVAQGGSNPAIRTLFYRFVRLLGHSIQPLFVFDGPKKPAFKRGKRSTGTGDAVSKAMMKRMIQVFGFTAHDAPGEAEAECALLQQRGVVDAVLSEDVDTIMFGCGKTMRSWSAESRKGQTPTHVTVYDAEKLRQGEKGLDREGMVLVALMSGGDYIPEGIPNCGVKIACEAARAGFGTSLCRIKKSDQAAIDEWKADLLHELRTNEKGFFRTKHKALTIPESFPNMEVLRYYTHPVVSQQTTVERLGREFPSKTHVDITGLRDFVRDTFDWTCREGAIKLVRVLAPSLLVQSLLAASTEEVDATQERDVEKRKETTIVKTISNRRAHFSTDAMPELRISYVPIDMVPLDLDAEPVDEEASFGREGLALNSDDEFEEEVAEAVDSSQATQSKTKPFDVFSPNPVWVAEHIVQLGVPLTFEDWEEAQRQKTLDKEAKAAAPKRGRKRPVKRPDMLAGALDKYLKVTKDVTGDIKDVAGNAPLRPRSPLAELLASPKKSAAPQITFSSSPPMSSNPFQGRLASPTRDKPAHKPRAKAASKQTSSSTTSQTNPWMLAGSQIAARVTKSSNTNDPKLATPEPGYTGATTPTRKRTPAPSDREEPIVITSSPVAVASPSLLENRMTGTQQPEEEDVAPRYKPCPMLSSSPPPVPAVPASPKARRKPTPPRASPGKRPNRTQSGAASRKDDLPPLLKQTSIMSYGIMARVPPASSNKPPPGLTHSDPVTLPSDDDESASAPMPSYRKREFKKSATFAGRSSGAFDNDLGPPHSDPVSDGEDFAFPSVDEMVGERHTSARPKKSKLGPLYVPRKSAVGFFREEYPKNKEDEERKVREGALRASDVAVVDIPGDD